MRNLRRGHSGPAVSALQKGLAALGLYLGPVSGFFNKDVLRAVLVLQERAGLRKDGVVGPQTLSALYMAQNHVEPSDAQKITRPVLRALLDLVSNVCAYGKYEHLDPVRYGPGRGLFHEGKWVITRGPGGLNRDQWRSRLGRTFPSFHCSSWTNFLMGWLLNRNERFTHQGNMPPIWSVCRLDSGLHDYNGVKFRGYGESTLRLAGDGSTKLGRGEFLDYEELWRRRAELSVVNVCAQSTKRGPGLRWKWWHHTFALIVIPPEHRDWVLDTGEAEGWLTQDIRDRLPEYPMLRIAADGGRGRDKRYSGTPMNIEVIGSTEALRMEDKYLMQCWRMVSMQGDGTYGAGEKRALVIREK